MAESPGRTLPTLLTTANSPVTVVTAGGAGAYTIVRSLIVANEVDSPVRVTVILGTSNTDAAGKRLLRQFTILPNKTEDVLEGRYLPLMGHASTPDLLAVLCDTASGASVTAGYITGP
jgi:hypothetical protein